MSRLGRSVLLLGLLGDSLTIERLEVHRRQHQGRETTLYHQRINTFPGIGKQDVGSDGRQYLAQGLALNTDHKEDARLLDLHQERRVLTHLGSHGQGQHNLVVALLVHPGALGVEIDVYIRLPLLPKNVGGGRGFKGNIFGVNPLQRELLLGCLAICRGLFISHGVAP